MHGLLTGQESRQQLYTMLTRGRHANHLYLQVVGDGDPHSIIRPDTIAPHTPTETLRQILGLTDEPAWPTLRAHLLALAAETGEHPLRHMMTAVSGRDLQ